MFCFDGLKLELPAISVISLHKFRSGKLRKLFARFEIVRGCCVHVFLVIVFAFIVNYSLPKSARLLQTYRTVLNATQLMSLSIVNNWGKDLTEKTFCVCIVSILNTIIKVAGTAYNYQMWVSKCFGLRV